MLTSHHASAHLHVLFPLRDCPPRWQVKLRFQSQILAVSTDVKPTISKSQLWETNHRAVHARELKGQQNKAPGGLFVGTTCQKDVHWIIWVTWEPCSDFLSLGESAPHFLSSHEFRTCPKSDKRSTHACPDIWKIVLWKGCFSPPSLRKGKRQCGCNHSCSQKALQQN